MFIFLIIFIAFFSVYYYLSYQVILLNDLEQIFSQTATKAQEDLKQYSDLLLEDLGKCYVHVLLIILFAAIATFIWILLMKYNAKLIIWLSIFSLPILLSVGLYFSIKTYISLKDAGEYSEYMPNEQTLAFDKALQTILTAELLSYIRNETLWLVISIILLITLIALVIILHSLKERVNLSITLIRQASKAINQVKSTLVFPIFPRAIGIAAIIFGILTSLLIISASHPTYHVVGGPGHGRPCHPTNRTSIIPQRSNNVTSQCVMSQPLKKHVWKYHALNLFATLWLVHFISAISQTTLAGAFASYYWASRKQAPFFAVTASLYRVLRYHLGDIAFGSFLLATFRYIRIVIEFIGNRLRRKSSPGANNSQSVTWFLRIFFWVLDSFLKYIDKNAYIMMSMYGEGYLKSAKRAVELLYHNSTRALVVDCVTYFVLLVSRLLITGFSGFITAQEMFTGDLHYKWLPIVLVVLGTYFISKGLFSVYSMAVDTLFMCYLIEGDLNRIRRGNRDQLEIR